MKVDDALCWDCGENLAIPPSLYCKDCQAPVELMEMIKKLDGGN